MGEWANWATKNFQIHTEQEQLEIQHIPETQRGQIRTQLEEKTSNRNTKPNLHRRPTENPHSITTISSTRTTPTNTTTSDAQIYQADIQSSIQQLKNNKSHGIDGTPGEVYKELKGWITTPISAILQKTQQGDQLPPECAQGEMVHIYKTKAKYMNAKLPPHLPYSDSIQNMAHTRNKNHQKTPTS